MDDIQMIDRVTRGEEEAIPLPAARNLPVLRRAGGGRPDLSTLHRWATRGVLCRATGMAVRLATFRQGARVMTTAEAVARFVAATNGGELPHSTPTDATRRAHDESMARLRASGMARPRAKTAAA